MTFAPSCLKRPIAVCLRGVEVGSCGSISTMYPKRLGSLTKSGLCALKRGSYLSQPVSVDVEDVDW